MPFRYFENIDDINITNFYDGNDGYILWHPWFGAGINNFRQSLEIAYSISFLTNRILVIPSFYNFNFLNWGINFGTGWGLNDGNIPKEKINIFNFFSISGINVITIEDFCKEFGFIKWNTEDKHQKIFYNEIPPQIKIINDFTNPYVIYDDKNLLDDKFNRRREPIHINSLIPKNKKFVYLYQSTLGIYYQQFVSSKTNILKKLINKYIRINDEIFNYADNILKKINVKYNAIHIRRFIQYFETIKPAEDIIEILLKEIPKGSNLYISTDDKINETNMEFYQKFKDNFNVMFYEDFDVSSPLFEPLIETLICARSDKFFAQFPSTFSSYIWRLRGLMGDIDTTYYDNYKEYDVNDNDRYLNFKGSYSFFGRETSDAWLYD